MIDATGASKSRDEVGNEPPSRPAALSGSADQPPREQGGDADMGDPESERRRPRELVEDEGEATRDKWRRDERPFFESNLRGFEVQFSENSELLIFSRHHVD